jgi:hypothetical protein
MPKERLDRLCVPKTSSTGGELHFDAWRWAQRASGSDPVVPLPGVLPHPPAHPTRRSQ